MFEKLANVLKHLIKFIIGLGLGLLIIIHKESLLRQLFFLLRSLRNTLYAKKTLLLISSGGDRFSKFLIGQFLECIVFGILCYAALFITRMPFAPILAILLAVGNLIPIIGAYIAGGIGLLLVFTESPHLSLLFILIIIIVQQIEQWTTYPLIVGKYMQLNGFWILFGVVIGGGLFGFWGLLLCVPTLSFLHDVIVIFINKKQLLKLPPDS
jgi:predicted PurR-regulated permease PerM